VLAVKASWRLALFLALFVGLAGAGIAWAVRSTDVSLRDLGELWRLPVATLFALGALCASLYVTDVMRYRAFGRAVGEPLAWRAAWDASVANFFFSWITPGAALGAPAAIVMLGRRGVSWEGATLIAFGKSVTGTLVILGLAFGVLAAGLGPALDRAALVVLTTGTGVVVAVILVPMIAALWPEASIRRIDRIEAWLARRRVLAGERRRRVVARIGEGLRETVRRLAKLRTGGVAVVVALIASHVLYLSVIVAIGVVLAMAFGATALPAAIGITIVYVAFTYVAPTPGGAGLAEAAATLFYGSILPARDAVLVVLLFRALTFYLEVLVGIVYLGVVGGIRQVLERKVKT
jgi:uncharacterized protein (TIRG00374 family)